MSLISSLLGRRQFLIAFIGCALVPIFARIAKAFDLIFKSSEVRASDKSGTSENKPLKGIVVYYSATGNTGKIAGAIYRGMKSVMDCDVAPIKKIDPKALARYDVIAIGGPVYHFREPAALKLFIYRMSRMTNKQFILFCTHGPNPDSLFYGLEHSLRKKEAIIIGWNDWYGGSYINLHSPMPAPTDGHPDEIDLEEAEIFGREMAEHATRIYGGERNLIPEIPTGPDADRLWIANRGGGARGAESESINTPIIDMSKCIYPRCSACADNCIANAIDLSMTAAAVNVSESPIFINGCLHCGLALCIRSCAYDAITYEQNIQQHAIDLEKCTYPKCTLCADKCPMDTIDFSHSPPVFHKNCEGCDLCSGICPTGAIEITNFAEVHGTKMHAAEKITDVYTGFYEGLNKAKATGKFRPLVPIDKIGFDTPLSTVKRIPLFVLSEENFPYYINEG